MPEERRHIAILFSDIVGYTSLMGSDENKALDMLSRNRTIHETHIQQFNGTFIKDIGDAILGSFSLASDAVRCAIEIQKSCKEDSIPLKIGIHEGEVVFKDSDVFGDGVNIASRLQSDAQQGCINISGSVYRDIKNKSDIRTGFNGEKTFKNVDEPIKVYQVLCEGTESGDQDTKLSNRNDNKIKHPYYLLSGTLVLIITLLLIWRFMPFNKTDDLEKSIAVLPLKYLSEDQNKEYLANSVMDAITGHLSTIEGLRVMPRTSMEQYRETTKTSQEIGKELDVSYLVEGSFQMVEDQVKLIIQLIIAQENDHLFFNEYNRDYNDILNVQSELAQTIAKEIGIAISPDVKERMETIPTHSQEAYDNYLRGRDFQDRGGEKLDINMAIHFYQKAIELDPEFALAYVWLGIAYHRKTYWSDYFKETFGDTLIYFADKSLLYNPNLAEGYWLRGIYYQQISEYDKGISELENATDLNPNFGNAYRTLAEIYMHSKQYTYAFINFEKAKKLIIGSPEYIGLLFTISWAYGDINDYNKVKKICVEIENYNPIGAYIRYGYLYWSTGEFDKLKFYTDKVCAIDSGEYCVDMLSILYSQTERFVEANKYSKRWRNIRLKQGYIGLNNLHRDAFLYWHLEKKDTAKVLFEKQIEYCEESIRLNRSWAISGGAYYDLAATLAFLNNKERAYQILHDMEKMKAFGGYLGLIKVDPLFEDMWHDEEFKQIIERQEKYYAAIRAELDQLEKEGKL